MDEGAAMGELIDEMRRVELRLGGVLVVASQYCANLPYSIATPLLIRTIAELPSLRRWMRKPPPNTPRG